MIDDAEGLEKIGNRQSHYNTEITRKLPKSSNRVGTKKRALKHSSIDYLFVKLHYSKSN